MTRGQRASVAVLASSISTASMTCGAGASSNATPPAALTIQDAQGQLIWQAVSRSPVDVTRIDAEGRILLSDGTRLDADGRVRLRLLNAAVPGDGDGDGVLACPSWDPLSEITPPPNDFSDSHAPLLVDSQGNVWVIMTHIESGDYSLRIRRSIGHTGAWDPVEIVLTTTRYVSQPEGAIDTNDIITVVFREISGGYHLYAVRYEPGTGWGTLTPVWGSGDFFQAIEAAADSEGNVVVVIDPNTPSNTVQVLVRDAATGLWSGPVQVSPPGADTLLPTLSQNRSGTALPSICSTPPRRATESQARPLVSPSSWV